MEPKFVKSARFLVYNDVYDDFAQRSVAISKNPVDRGDAITTIMIQNNQITYVKKNGGWNQYTCFVLEPGEEIEMDQAEKDKLIKQIEKHTKKRKWILF